MKFSAHGALSLVFTVFEDSENTHTKNDNFCLQPEEKKNIARVTIYKIYKTIHRQLHYCIRNGQTVTKSP